jgi:hypothetical protein
MCVRCPSLVVTYGQSLISRDLKGQQRVQITHGPTDDIASSHRSDDIYQPDNCGVKWCYWVTTIFAFMNGCKRQV